MIENSFSNVKNNSQPLSSDTKTVVPSSQELEKSIPDIYSKQASYCDKHHLSSCSCQDSRIEEELSKKREDFLSDLQDEGIDPDSYVALHRWGVVKKNVRKLVGDALKSDGVRCPLELKEIQDFVSVFSHSYDVRDAKVSVVLSTLLSARLQIRKQERLLASQGLQVDVHTEDGGSYKKANDLSHLHIKYNDLMVASIEKLERMINGEKKLSLNFNADVDSVSAVPFENLFGDSSENE